MAHRFLGQRWIVQAGLAKRIVTSRLNSLVSVSVVVLILALAVHADTTSYTGTLASSDTTVQFLITLASAGTVTLQTYGFGGGTNGAGNVIAPGGTDPFLAIFSGTGNSASILTDGSANPFGTSLDLTNYGNPDFLGCPPAGAPVYGGSAQCGDITMSLSLSAGAYTVLLSDGQYIANAVFDNGTLGEGFTDLTASNFCNVNINGVDCTNSGAYALDITTPSAPVPEPATLALCTGGLAVVWRRKRKSR